MPILFLRLLFLSYPLFEPLEAASVCCLHVVHAFRDQERGVNARLDRRRNYFLRVFTKLFWRAIYCANPIPKTDSHSGYLSRRVLVRQYPQIIWEYNIRTAVLIQPLTQPRTCYIDSSIFAAMS